MGNISIENRIRELRKALNLTQSEFGLKLGVTVGVISNLELHRNKTNTATDPICNLICSTFNVNPNWLYDGIGDMFLPLENNSLSQLQKERHLSDKAIKLIDYFSQMDEAEQDDLIRTLKKLISD